MANAKAAYRLRKELANLHKVRGWSWSWGQTRCEFQEPLGMDQGALEAMERIFRMSVVLRVEVAVLFLGPAGIHLGDAQREQYTALELSHRTPRRLGVWQRVVLGSHHFQVRVPHGPAVNLHGDALRPLQA